MIGIPSIPSQIRQGAISGDLEVALRCSRLAHSRNESHLITQNLSIMGLANILRSSAAKNDLNKDQIKIMTNLLFIDNLSLAAGSIIIRYFIKNNGVKLELPSLAVIEILNVLALEVESVSDSDLIATANLLLAQKKD